MWGALDCRVWRVVSRPGGDEEGDPVNVSTQSARSARVRAAAVGVLALLVLATPALARDEQPVVPGVRLFAEMPDDGEFAVPVYGVRGQVLSVKLLPWLGADLEADLSLESPTGEDVDLDGVLFERTLRNRRKGDRVMVQLRRLVLGETGVYRLMVTPRGDTSGGFDLTTTARPPRARPGRGEITTAGEPASVVVEAAPGDMVTIIARGRGRPRFKPVVERLVYASGTEVELGDAGRSGPMEITEVGVHRFEIGHPESETGAFSYALRLRRPRPDRTPVDLATLQASGVISGRVLVDAGGGRGNPAKAGTELTAAGKLRRPLGGGVTEVPQHRSGQMIVHAPRLIGAATLTDVLAEEVPGASFRRLHSMSDSGPHLVEITHLAGRAQSPRDQARTRTIISALAGTRGVELVEPNIIRHAFKNVNDPQIAAQDGLKITLTPPAWDLQEDARNVTIAVLDSGQLGMHPDLHGVYVTGRDFVSDVWNSFDGDGWDSVPFDAHQGMHGTMVSGVLGARTDNGIGIAGVCHTVKVQPVRVLGKYGAYDYDTAAAVVWAAGGIVLDVPFNPIPADVINLSIGGTGKTEALGQALSFAKSQGILIVAAAGNSSSSVVHYPAGYSSVMAVASVDRNLVYSYFSNYGNWLSLSAPGGDFAYTGRGILTTSYQPRTNIPIYEEVQGTSFAAPHVAGAAALIMAHDPFLTVDEIRQILQETAIDVGPPGFDSDYGWGVLDVWAAVRQAVQDPPMWPATVVVSPPELVFGPNTTTLPVRITNGGSGGIAIEAVVGNPVDVGGTWLTATTDSDSLPATIEVAVARN